MTTIEMSPLLDHPDQKVRKLALEYATLWDASQDLCTTIYIEDFECEIEGTPTGDCYEKLLKVLAGQPNERKDAK